MRTLTLLLCLPALLVAQDAAEIIRRSLAEDSASAAIARNYTYIEKQELRTRDGNTVRVRQSNTYDVTLLEGSPYRRLVARDGKPLSAEDQRKEEEKLRLSIENRRHETEEQKQQRNQRQFQAFSRTKRSHETKPGQTQSTSIPATS